MFFIDYMSSKDGLYIKFIAILQSRGSGNIIAWVGMIFPGSLPQENHVICRFRSNNIPVCSVLMRYLIAVGQKLFYIGGIIMFKYQSCEIILVMYHTSNAHNAQYKKSTLSRKDTPWSEK